jgi:hypothetical protein
MILPSHQGFSPVPTPEYMQDTACDGNILQRSLSLVELHDSFLDISCLKYG